MEELNEEELRGTEGGACRESSYKNVNEKYFAYGGNITIDHLSSSSHFVLEDITTWGGQRWQIREMIFPYPSSGVKKIIRIPNGTQMFSATLDRGGKNAILKIHRINRNLEEIKLCVTGSGVKSHITIQFK